MIVRSLLRAGAVTLGFSLAASAAAHGLGGFMCETFNPSKTMAAVTHCVTWSKEAKARMARANCDPAKMSAAEMRARCAELAAAARTPGG